MSELNNQDTFLDKIKSPDNRPYLLGGLATVGAIVGGALMYRFFAKKSNDINVYVERNHIRIPALGLGTWKSKDGTVGNAVKVAVRNGYRHIDCAHIYENEAEVGEALKELREEGYNRDDIWITSKLWSTSHKPSDVRPALEKTLENLGLEQLDLYLIHWPMYFVPEGETGEGVNHIATWKAMEACVEAGLVKHIGVSNFTIEQIQNILQNCTIRPTFLQCESHPYLPQDELLEFCKQENIIFQAYSPLGSPDSQTNPKDSDPTPLLKNDVVLELAEKYGKNAGQILIKYQIQRGNVVLAKSITPERIISNIQLNDFTIENSDMDKLTALNCNWRACAFSSTKDLPNYPF